ncbi:hypothetical protein VNO77_01970 [Canavalia gladiata]|uniref:Uncharacterized protein n=1 Tax=Canavalia gladiata TaxID=3824 RepID=A0AAN9MX04_CANGL
MEMVFSVQNNTQPTFSYFPPRPQQLCPCRHELRNFPLYSVITTFIGGGLSVHRQFGLQQRIITLHQYFSPVTIVVDGGGSLLIHLPRSLSTFSFN